MKFSEYKIRKASWHQLFYLLLPLVVFSGCNKEIEGKLLFSSADEIDKEYAEKSYKVAYIVIDGAVGSVVAGEATDYNNMPFLGSMTNNGLFSWNSIASNASTDINFYADLLTGVKADKHKVTSDDLSAAQLSKYPLVFDRLKKDLNIRTSVLTSNAAVQRLSENSTIDNRQLLVSDEEVVREAKKELGREDAHFTLITLNGVDKVGQATGYGPKNGAYISALHTVDNQLKDIVSSIQSREKYDSEKWLIVVASNRGGDYVIDPNMDDNSLYSVPFRNNFVLFYNNQFKYKIVERMDLSDPTYDGSAIRYT